MDYKYLIINTMKNIIKTSLVVLTILSFAACGSKKDKPTGDSVTVKIDSTTKTSIDSTKKDTVKIDTSKKDSTKKM
jgi:predicted small lipoprotein YifL